MRKVKIVTQMSRVYPFAVVDQGTGAMLLQHQKWDDLADLCRRLEWVVEDERGKRELARSSVSTDEL